MMLDPDQRARLARMEEARRQTRRHLDLIERQIIRRMTAVIPLLRPTFLGKRPAFGRGKLPDSNAFMSRYRERLAAITLERQPEIDALSRKLSRQERALAAFRNCHEMPDAAAA